MYRQKICLLLLLMLLVSGCGGSEPVAEPTPTATRTPYVEPTATATATATLTPTPTATPEAVFTPPPPDVNPLTGLRMDDPSVLDRVPVAIKVSNSREARPQSGLASADWVFEHLSEGRVTRLTAIFYSESPEQVGSVRSGRLIDLEIPAMVGGIFAFSGASGGVKDRMRNSDLFPARVISPDFGVGQPYFYRVPRENIAFEHTLFTNPAVLRELATERGINERPDFPVYLAFSETPPAGGTPVDYIEINYLLNYNTAEWTYDPAIGRWRRAVVGTNHMDYLTGEQLTSANVVLVYANHIESDFWEEMIGDMSNWKLSIEIQVWGQGPALILRDGRAYPVHWRRAERDHMLTFWDDAGNPVPLKPGNTWFQLVPLGTESEEFAPGSYRFTP